MLFRLSTLLLLPLGLEGCLDTCGNEIVRVATAPGGGRDAVVCGRECGAPTGFTTQISVLARGEIPSEAGNIFIADRGRVATRWGGPWAEVRWLSPDRLLVSYDANARLFAKRPELGGIRIFYRPVAAGPLRR